MVINQGDLFWIKLEEPLSSSGAHRHPYVVVQNNVFNSSMINTVVVCALSYNTKLATVPGNVFLRTGEANLGTESVVNISQVFTVPKERLGDKFGTLSPKIVRQIVDGVKLLLTPNDVE
ncbi:MAG: type II toxin-antitoxin system PemK/MazF family toxin [Okeania sp. SIO2H7]|nr:type II toxin-antitoxin system PemK/MazF family toxin [Okeania sp. SIO2H7]